MSISNYKVYYNNRNIVSNPSPIVSNTPPKVKPAIDIPLNQPYDSANMNQNITWDKNIPNKLDLPPGYDMNGSSQSSNLILWLVVGGAVLIILCKK